ncbi:TauD/TfdA family dioxygenase [Streptomyces sp. NBC_00162]|uniref:TauD/TfdA family dioxygenase n=1 Tax=Streptomyces sp. NBC_00162 TaxID=2903629 RepID=UPI00214CE23D|nr:TauD/TfdA family dioxygenase [Streptomyces sp. NBC_00162]UUU43269.1 TauD/TfdA family dioxygenase [Streptomyces sp. NBC_00162]
MTQLNDLRAGAPSVTVSQEWDGRSLPALVRADVPGIGLADWISTRKPLVDDLARRAGAVLFRGFEVTDSAAFRTVMGALSDEVLKYGERSSPRTEVSDNIYTSTEHPADQHILLHNEQSYTENWPLRIVFCCERPADRGGRTPLADSRKVLARLRPQTVAKFERLGVQYVRNYIPGISLSWQETFQTDDPEQVRAYCEGAGISVEWVDGIQLRTRQTRPALHRHPVTGDRTWFNHAVFFHVTSLAEEVCAGLRAALGEENLPYNTYYGDGTPIEDETLAELRAAFTAETTGFDWELGDVLLVENMITAHAREPFEGPRRILAAMSDPVATIREGAAA